MLFAFLYLQYVSSMTSEWPYCTQQTTFPRQIIVLHGLWEGCTRINNNFYDLHYRVYKLVLSKNIFSLFSQWPYSDVYHRVLSRDCRALQISEICSRLLLLLASCWKTYTSTAAFLYFHTLFCIYILHCCVLLCSDYIPHKSECLLKSIFKNKLTENCSETPFVKWLDSTETWGIW